MKKFYAILCLAIASLTQLQAQAPQGFNYQATVRDSAGDLIVNANVYFKFNVIQGSLTAVPIFTETHYVSTDDLGQVNLVIGQGTANLGSFSALDWSLGSYYLGIELDTGNGYLAMGTTQLLSVPYALYAENSGNSTPTTPNLEAVLAENNSANNQQIKDLQDPTEAQDAVTKAYFENNTTSSGLSPGSTVGDMLYWDGENWTQIPSPENNGTLKFCDGQLTWGPCKAEIKITGFNVFSNNTMVYVYYDLKTNDSDVYDIRAFISGSNPIPDENDNVYFGYNSEGYLPFPYLQGQVDISPFNTGSYYIRLRIESSLGVSYSDVFQYSFTELDIDNDGDSYNENQGDCDDTDASINPGATEIEDGIDNDCDGEVDEGFNADGTVTDQDGNTYDYLSYGNQVWTVDNAEMVTYRDGTPIPQVTDNTEWQNLTTGAWAYYNNDPTKPRLYNWYAVMGIHDTDPNTPNKEFAPEGWHVSSDAEWTTLENHLIANGYNYDDTTTENKIAKAMASTTGWNSSTSTGVPGNDQSLNNDSEFNAVPEGLRYSAGSFNNEGFSAFFWSSTGFSTAYAWNRNLNNQFSYLNRANGIASMSKRDGFSVRFVRD